MIMVSARLTRRWRLLVPPGLGERRHRRLARRLVAVRRRARGEFISYSEWESEAAIDAYRSAAHARTERGEG